MIKVFSAETFNDYNNQATYGSIYTKNEPVWNWYNGTFRQFCERFKQFQNETYADVDAFQADMISRGYLHKNGGQYEILDYDQFLSYMKSWFDISNQEEKGHNEQLNLYTDNYIDCQAFGGYVMENDDKFADDFVARVWLNQLFKDNIIESIDSRGRIYDMDKFRLELVKVLKGAQVQTVADKIINDKESGITKVNAGEVLLFYIFLAAEDKRATINIQINVNYSSPKMGRTYDLSEYQHVVNGNQIEGYDALGIVPRVHGMYFLDFNKFASSVNSAANAKGISLPQNLLPLAFVNEQVTKGILTNVTNTPYGQKTGVTTRYKIENLSVFRTNYSIYRIGCNITDLVTANGDMVLDPTECVLDVEINSAWTLTLKHRFDPDGKYSFIQKGCVIAIDSKIAREQTYPCQLYRVYDVQNVIDGVEVTGYPVAQESAFECPIDNLLLENKTAAGVAEELSAMYPEKYLIQTDIQNGTSYIYAQNSNMQEVIAGDDEATFVNTYGGEIIYDNYIYRIMNQAGRKLDDSEDYLISYGANLKGITITENTFDVVTRVYPTSGEGYNLTNVQDAFYTYYNEYGDLLGKVPERYEMDFTRLVDAVVQIDTMGYNQSPAATDPNKMYTSNSAFGTIIYGLTTGGVGTHRMEVKDQCSRFVTRLFQLNYIDGIYRDDQPIVVTATQTSFRIGDDNYGEEVPATVTYSTSTLEGATIRFKKDKVNPRAAIPGELSAMFSSLRTNLFATMVVETIYTQEKRNDPTQVPKYIDAPNIADYPFVHARSIAHDDIQLIEEYDPERDIQQTETMKMIAKCKTAIKAKTKELSKSYLKKAHAGKWNHKKRIKIKSRVMGYSGEDAIRHMHDEDYNPRTDRVSLPYGYLFYSYKDSIEYLKDQCVLSWCKDENETAIFCQAIEDGFKWCEKTNIAKWSWHSDNSGKYYGRADRKNGIIRYAHHKIGSKLYWFTSGGNIIKKLLDYEEYKWVDDPYEKEETEGEGDDATTKKVTIHRYRYQNEKGKYMKSTWIEESASKHYYVDSNGYRKEFKSTQNPSNTIDYDDGEWTLKPGKDGVTFRITGYSYGNHKAGHYPNKGQYMYIKDLQGWYRFDDDKGTIKGLFLSNGSWNWKKYKKGWRYTDGHRNYLTRQWAKIDGKWYYFYNGYADPTTDDFSENSQSFHVDDKKPDVDYNREGIGSTTTASTTEEKSAADQATYNADRDGVVAWCQDDFVKDLKRLILQWHTDIWETLEARLINAAVFDLQQLRNESMSVEVDMDLLRKYEGFEQLAFLDDLYLGDYVHVRSSLHNFDGDLRVVSLSYDCVTKQLQTITLGYPVNSFIRRSAMMNKSGVVKHYSPDHYIESGYGDYIDDGSVKQPYIPV